MQNPVHYHLKPPVPPLGETVETSSNGFLRYVLTMAIADGFLKDPRYVRRLVAWLEGVDLEDEYAKIMARQAGYGKGSSLSSAMRRRVVALVEYARAKEAIGPKAAEDGTEAIEVKGLPA